MANRKIKITYKKGKDGLQRPPLITTELNLPNQEKFFGSIIEEVYPIDDNGNIIKKEKPIVRTPVIINKETGGITLKKDEEGNNSMVFNGPQTTAPTMVFDVFKDTVVEPNTNDIRKTLIALGKSEQEIEAFLNPAPKKVAVKRVKKDKNDKS
jgi:hypothetical protein